MPAKKDRIRELACDYYVQHIDVTLQDVAEMYGITYKTVQSWKEKYRWDDLRRDFHSSPVRIKQALQEEVISVSIHHNTPKFKADDISKLMASIDRCEKKLDPTIVAHLLRELDVFINKIDPKFAAEARKYHRQFLTNRIKQLT